MELEVRGREGKERKGVISGKGGAMQWIWTPEEGLFGGVPNGSRQWCLCWSREREEVEREKMGGRRPILVGLVLVMVLGCAIYFRLWTIDYTISSDETEILRFVSIFYLLFNSRALFLFSWRKSPFDLFDWWEIFSEQLKRIGEVHRKT